SMRVLNQSLPCQHQPVPDGLRVLLQRAEELPQVLTVVSHVPDDDYEDRQADQPIPEGMPWIRVAGERGDEAVPDDSHRPYDGLVNEEDAQDGDPQREVERIPAEHRARGDQREE